MDYPSWFDQIAVHGHVINNTLSKCARPVVRCISELTTSISSRGFTDTKCLLIDHYFSDPLDVRVDKEHLVKDMFIWNGSRWYACMMKIDWVVIDSSFFKSNMDNQIKAMSRSADWSANARWVELKRVWEERLTILFYLMKLERSSTPNRCSSLSSIRFCLWQLRGNGTTQALFPWQTLVKCPRETTHWLYCWSWLDFIPTIC